VCRKIDVLHGIFQRKKERNAPACAKCVSAQETYLIVLILESLDSLVSKLHYQGPVLVVKGRLQLEIDSILKTRALAIHEAAIAGVVGCFMSVFWKVKGKLVVEEPG
jgi:hypothetical protein